MEFLWEHSCTADPAEDVVICGEDGDSNGWESLEGVRGERPNLVQICGREVCESRQEPFGHIDTQ